MPRPQTLRQILVLFGLLLCNISDGFIFGQMSGMLDALHSKNGEVVITEDQLSWIASILNITCLCGFGFAAMITNKVGRRWTIVILSLPLVASWIMLYYAQEVILFLLSRAIVGVSYGGVLLLCLTTAAEYTAPNLRGFFLHIVSAVGPTVGIAAGHILGIFLHWRTVALIGIMPAALSAVIPLLWVESPSWLASKGRFEECETSFRALRGYSVADDKELNQLIEVEKQKIDSKINHATFTVFVKSLKKKYTWNVCALVAVVSVYRVAAGKVLFSIYAVTMLQDITGSSDILLFMFLVDGLAVVGSFLSCVLVKHMKMRSLLFSAGLAGNILLVTVSLCLYYAPKGNTYVAWINSTVLGLYFITINAGVNPVLEAMYAELFPMEIKLYGITFLAFLCSCAFFLSIKLAPHMFSVMGYHGVFLLNVGIMSLCIIYLWIYLPETKGKSLQDIELYFKSKTGKKIDEENEEQAKMLA